MDAIICVMISFEWGTCYRHDYYQYEIHKSIYHNLASSLAFYPLGEIFDNLRRVLVFAFVFHIISLQLCCCSNHSTTCSLLWFGSLIPWCQQWCSFCYCCFWCFWWNYYNNFVFIILIIPGLLLPPPSCGIWSNFSLCQALATNFQVRRRLFYHPFFLLSP